VKDNPLKLRSLKDLAQPQVRVIAIPDATFNSAGHAFVQSMQNLGVWEQIRDRVTEKPNPKDATTLVEKNEGADACVTYGSCYVFGHAKSTHLLAFIPTDQYQPIRCPGALVQGTSNRELGEQFLDFLLTDQAQDLFVKWGFGRIKPKSSKGGKSILVLAGAGLRDALDPLGEAYRKKTGVRVDFSYGGAGTLLAQLAFSKVGDLYIPGELRYVQQAEERGLILETRIACYFVPVLAVQKDNPKKIRSLEDLVRPGIEVGLGDPRGLAIGPVGDRILERAKLTKAIAKNVVFRAGCIPELANALKLKTIDATILWDATAFQNRDHIDTLEIPAKWNEAAVVPVGVLRCAQDVDAARRFAEYLTTSEAKAIFREHGYTTEEPTGLRVPSLQRELGR